MKCRCSNERRFFKLEKKIEDFSPSDNSTPYYTDDDVALLLSNLEEGETVRIAVMGRMGAVYKDHPIAITDRRVISVIRGRGGILHKITLMFSEIDVVTSPAKLASGHITLNSAKKSHGVQLTRGSATSFAETVRMGRSSITDKTTHVSEKDSISQLEKLGELLNKGLLTQQEFDLEKAKLLSGGGLSTVNNNEELALLKKIVENSAPKPRDPALAAVELFFLLLVLWFLVKAFF